MSTEIDNRRQIPILVDLEQEVHPSSPVGTSVSSESIPFIETITPPEPIVFQESRSDKPDPSTLRVALMIFRLQIQIKLLW